MEGTGWSPAGQWVVGMGVVVSDPARDTDRSQQLGPAEPPPET